LVVASATCPYCIAGSFDGPLNDDHVIPAKLGGTFVVRAHARCNKEAADHVDNVLMRDPDVEMLRALSGARNTRTRKVKGAQFPGQLGDRAPALLRASPGGVDLEQVAASEPLLTESGDFVFTVPVTNVAEHTERVLTAMRAKYPGKTVELVQQEARHEDVSIQRTWGMVPWAWPRFAAKVALAALAVAMPPEWRGSHGELTLLALYRCGQVHGSPSGGIPCFPTPVDYSDFGAGLVYPWEHTIVLTHRDGVVTVTIVLFGALRYSLGIATEVRPVGPSVWLCDYREREPLTFGSMSEYAAALTERLALFGHLGSLRRDHPRGRLLGPRSVARLRESRL
jgi:hypothetical protein